MTDDTLHGALRRALQSDIDGNRITPTDRLRSLREARVAFYEEVASLAAPAFNAALAERSAENLEAQRDLCAWANQALSDLGLAVRCPRTGKPALLLVDVRTPGDDLGRFRLEVRDDRNRPQRTFCATALPEFELTQRRDRVEPLVNRGRRDQGGGRSR